MRPSQAGSAVWIAAAVFLHLGFCSFAEPPPRRSCAHRADGGDEAADVQLMQIGVVPADTEEDDGEAVPSTQRGRNPAGCISRKKRVSLEDLGGVYPLEDFREMLDTRKAKLGINGTKYDYELSQKMGVPWCPVPLSDSPFQQEDAEFFAYLETRLEGVDRSMPLVVAVVETFGRSDYHMVQTSNFICGLKRLGLDQRAVIFALENATAVQLRQQFPDVRVLFHPSLLRTLDRVGTRVSVPMRNRIGKLVVASMLVDRGYEMIVSDLDMYWAQDPTGYLQSLKTPSGDPVEFAAMRDFCWLELNSGFLYYRPTASTKLLLRSALSTVRFATVVDGQRVAIFADNDQYLLNCAFARAALQGMRYVIVPEEQFLFGTFSLRCHSAEGGPTQRPAPLVWHTSGFSTTFEREFDTFAAAGLLDIDMFLEPQKATRGGGCLAGKRGSAADVASFNATWFRMCFFGPERTGASLCNGGCAGETGVAAEVLGRYKGLWTASPPS